MEADGFEWDDAKAASNFGKHGVTFGEAATVFDDPLTVTWPDPDHSDDEDRFLTVGHSAAGRTVIVSHTDREDRIRIISAREANRREQRGYEDGTFP
jgi:uncharacterized DUF497 family protein